jgi:hypothetical protein
VGAQLLAPSTTSIQKWLPNYLAGSQAKICHFPLAVPGLRADVCVQRHGAFQNRSGGVLCQFRVVPFFLPKDRFRVPEGQLMPLLVISLTLETASTNLPFPAGGWPPPPPGLLLACCNCTSRSHTIPSPMMMVQHGLHTFQFQMLVNLVQNRCHPISTPHYSVVRKISNQIAPAQFAPTTCNEHVPLVRVS